MQDKMVDNRTAGGVGVQTVPNLKAEPQKRKKKSVFTEECDGEDGGSGSLFVSVSPTEDRRTSDQTRWGRGARREHPRKLVQGLNG